MRMQTILMLLMVWGLRSAHVQQSLEQQILGIVKEAPISGNDGPIYGSVIRKTQHFEIYAEDSFVPVDLEWLETEVETIHAYLVERMGAASAMDRFAMTFRPPDNSRCPKRGLASPSGQVIVFANERTTKAQVSGVLAHEIAHVLQFQGLRESTPDLNLIEGTATWAAGKYWNAWQGTPTENVRAFRLKGQYKPLEHYYRETAPATNPADCLKNRDLQYNSWAAFIDFLITEYGADKFHQLFSKVDDPASVGNPRATPYVAPVTDFNGIYGLSLSELEKLWLQRLD